MLTFGSLFSGIGGLDLGLERAGWTCRWQIEVDDFCRGILQKHWPDVPKFGDIREVIFENMERVDLICGGFPCQPVSIAGKQRAQNDPRWLWPEFARAIRVLRPHFVLVENVPGLLQRGMGDVLSDLAECGYDAEWQMLPSGAFGAPHIRQRVFIVAYSAMWGRHGQSNESQSEAIVFRRGFIIAEGTTHRGVHWAIEPDVVRVVDGFPGRMDRVMALGNAVVPQVAEFVGRLIIEVMREAA